MEIDKKYYGNRQKIIEKYICIETIKALDCSSSIHNKNIKL